MDESKSAREEREGEDATKLNNVRDPEKYQDSHQSESLEPLKLDSNGLPLVPQPSRFKDDPLVSTSDSLHSTPHYQDSFLTTLYRTGPHGSNGLSSYK